MSRGVQRFNDLRAWRVCDAYKKAIYRLLDRFPRLEAWSRWEQLEKSVAGPPAHLAEGFGRFNPLDFARYCVFARSSLMESQNHLIDAVDTRVIPEAIRLEMNELAEACLKEVTGLMEYLQSPEALRNARRARERRILSRPERQNPEPRTRNPEPGTRNPEPGTEPEHEPRSENQEP